MSATELDEMQDSFRHEAMIYSGLGDFMERTTSFIEDSLKADEPVLVVVDAQKGDLLAARFSDPRVRFMDMRATGINPGRIIPVWRDFVSDNCRAKGFRGIGEPVWAGRTPDEIAECQQHESLLNVAFKDTGPWWLVCPYDATALPADVIDEALASHPFYSDSHGEAQSSRYRGTDASAKLNDSPLPEPASVASVLSFVPGQLVTIRRLVRETAIGNGLDEKRTDELVLAVNELVTNSLRYGTGGGQLRIWSADGRVVCEVSDRGKLIDPLAGRKRPIPGAIGGYGLWMVNQICDLVQIRTGDSGTVIRVSIKV